MIKTVKTYTTRIEAELAKELLASYGIPSVIIADDAGGSKPFPFSYSPGVELKIDSANFQKALQLLSPSNTKKKSG